MNDSSHAANARDGTAVSSDGKREKEQTVSTASRHWDHAAPLQRRFEGSNGPSTEESSSSGFQSKWSKCGTPNCNVSRLTDEEVLSFGIPETPLIATDTTDLDDGGRIKVTALGYIVDRDEEDDLQVQNLPDSWKTSLCLPANQIFDPVKNLVEFWELKLLAWEWKTWSDPLTLHVIVVYELEDAKLYNDKYNCAQFSKSELARIWDAFAAGRSLRSTLESWQGGEQGWLSIGLAIEVIDGPLTDAYSRLQSEADRQEVSNFHYNFRQSFFFFLIIHVVYLLLPGFHTHCTHPSNPLNPLHADAATTAAAYRAKLVAPNTGSSCKNDAVVFCMCICNALGKNFKVRNAPRAVVVNYS